MRFRLGLACAEPFSKLLDATSVRGRGRRTRPPAFGLLSSPCERNPRFAHAPLRLAPTAAVKCRIGAWALWSRIRGEGMPDTNKHGQPCRVPRQQESGRPPKPDRLALAILLDEWMQGDAAEQQETFEVLRRSLDQDRPVGYKLFS